MFHHVPKTSVLFAVATTITLAAAPALADILYVSTTGNNANPCTLAQPCRSLQNAIGKTPAGGELHVLDSGFYGNNATIKKSITISGNGHTVMLGAPITINSAGAVVALRRLVLDGQGSVTWAIDTTAAAELHIEHCVVYGFNNGIRTGDTATFVSDTVVRNNVNIGLGVSGAGATKLSVNNSRFEHNYYGIFVENAESSITGTISSDNYVGIVARGGRMNVTLSTAALNHYGYSLNLGVRAVLESSVARGSNAMGVYVTGSTVVISNSVVSHNGTGIYNSNGTVLTRHNNTVTGNTTNSQGTVSVLGAF
jgi:hypothetical protein